LLNIKDIIKLIIPPIIVKGLRFFIQKLHAKNEGAKYNASKYDYDADKYWSERHKKFG
jgi:hypothetical protein